ncbi:MAG: hypothetical protein AB1521_09315 [Bacteroidota bacterium]
MKKIKISLLFLSLSLFMFILFSGCESDDEITNSNTDSFDSPQYAIIDYSDVENGIEDATLEKGMVLNKSLFRYTFVQGSTDFRNGNGPLRGNPWFDRFNFAKHIGRVLRRLDLSDDQKTAVHDFVIAFHDAVKPLLAEFHEINKPVIEEANAQRELIIEDLKNGVITREQAHDALKALNESTREKIKTNADNLNLKENLCNEKDVLFSNIESILTEEQLAQWNEAVSKMPDVCD